MSTISTHVLDTSRGKPAAGVPISFALREGDLWKTLGGGVTDADGRMKALAPTGFALTRAVYRLTFDTAAYFALVGVHGFYPEVVVAFEIREPGQHHHVPLLISPFGYSTYRGS